MRRLLLIPVLVVGLLGSAPLGAEGVSGKGSSHASHGKGTAKKSSTKKPSTPKASKKSTRRESTIKHPPVANARDSHGRARRSAEAKAQFMRRTGYPHGRPGYVVDHIVPLVCGGADSPSNMQWQTIAEAKAKDRIERRGCR